MSDRELIDLLLVRAKENASLPAENFGPLTGLYQTVSGWFGDRPWRLLIPLALSSSLLMRWFLGVEFVRLASLLQGGF